MSVHEIAALLLKLPELEIDEIEATAIARSLVELQKYYPQIDVPGRALAWMGLFGALGRVYVPRIAAYRLRMKNEANETFRRAA